VIKSKRLAQLITASMLISSIGISSVEATYYSGTIDNVGGTIVLGANYYTYATDNLTLNVTSDLILTNTVNQGRLFGFDSADKNIVFNMNNNTLSSTNIYGAYERKSNIGVYVKNAKDIYMFRPDGNTINIAYDKDVVYMQANHDITFDMGTNVTTNPPLVIGGNMVETMIAGNNFNIITFSNPINLSGGELDITAGQDINILSSGTSGGIWTGNKGTILNMTAQNGKIDILSTGGNTASLIVDSGVTGTLLANKDITIGGNTNRGIRANGGTVDITSTSGKIKVSATNTTLKSGSEPINAGIYAGTNTQRGTANLNSDTEISAVVRGVHANNGTVNFAKNVTVTEAQKGIVAENTGEVNVAGNANITSTDTNVAANNSKVTFVKEANLTGAQKGIVAENAGEVSVGGNAVITSTDTNVAANNSKVTFAKEASLTGAQKGIVAENAGEVSIAGNAVVTSTDTNVAANSSKVSFAQEASLTGAQKGIVAENAGEVSIAGNANITSTDTNVAANNSKVTFAKEASLTGAQKGIVAENASEVSIAGNAAITSTGTNVAANNSKVTFAKDVSLTGAQKGIVAENAGEVSIAGNAAITSTGTNVAADNGKVTFADALTLSGATTAISASNGGTVTDDNVTAVKKITGNIIADGAGSLVETSFATADSFFTGATTASNTGTINLDFSNGAPWNVTADSSLTNLVNNSTINMRYMGKNTNETITTANLSGNGIYIINTDLQASYDNKNVQTNGDKLIITASSSGSNVLDLRDISLDEKLASQGYLLLVEDQSNGSATFTGKDLAHGGIFKYRPVITTLNPTDYTGFNASAKNWYLTGFERTVEVSDNTNVTLGLNETRYGSYFTDNDTLLKRLGELRMMKNQPENDGVWAKYRHGVMEGKKFDGSFTTLQVGYDKKTSQKRYTGAAFSHTSNDFTLGAGTGGSSMDALTVYNTWLGDKNHYFDIVGKVGRMKGDSSYYDILFPENEEFSNWFYSLSGEYGRKNINNANGWYYEPQAQLTLGRINSSEYTTSLGTKVKMGSINSVLGRAGVTVGREYNRDNPDKHSNVYAKVNILHEFRGDVTTSLLDSYGDSYEPTVGYGGTWLNAGIGATVNFNKNTHIYFDLEKNFHGAVTSKWIGQLGCRWTW